MPTWWKAALVISGVIMALTGLDLLKRKTAG